MSTFPKNFPAGKGIWIWYLSSCLGGSIPAIIQKCKDNDISYVIIKCADGEKTWTQWNKPLIDAFHAAGIKILAWAYNYGYNPKREGEIALWALDMGADGYVFDPEAEYRDLPNNAAAAETTLKLIRQKYPDAFLAYSPLPIISNHPKFPYTTFSRYCSAVMPQCYWNAFQISPIKAVNWVFEEWLNQEKRWKQLGQEECIKPLIFVGSTYDYTGKINYTLKPSDVKEFITAIKGYKSVNFWSFQHIIRNDCWDAIKTTPIDKMTNADLGLPEQAIPQKPESGTTQQTVPSSTIGQQTQTPITPENPVSPTLPQSATTQPAPASDTPSSDGLIPVGEIPLPNNSGKVIVTIKNDPYTPNSVCVTVHDKVAIDYIQDFFKWLQTKLRGGVK